MIVLSRLAALAGLALLLCPALAQEPTPRPNILWITCEDMSPTLGCYGDPYARTPHLDSLASRSVRYTHAFSVAGVCAPSRSCLITGMYPSSLGTHHMRCQGRLPDRITCFTEPLRQAGYFCSNNVKTDYNFKPPPSAWDESSNRAHWRNRKQGQPFFSVFNFVTTHEGQIRAPQAQFERHLERLKDQRPHDPARANLPPFFPDSPIIRRDYARHADLISSMDAQVGQLLRQLKEDGLEEDTIVFFFSDHGMGLPRGKRWLYDTGIRVPLLIHFPRKFAKLAPAEAGKSLDRLVSFVDFGPTVQSLAAIRPAGHLQGIPFLGPHQGKAREHVFGIRDRMDERYDMTRAVRDRRFKYILNFLPHLPWAQPLAYMDEMPTMREWRRLAQEGKLEGPARTFLQPRKPVVEFYDTEKDPHELVNLADDPSFREPKERLAGALHEWMLQTVDLGLLPEAELHSRFNRKSPYEVVRATPDVYPLKKLQKVHEAVVNPAVSANELLALLKDQDSAVRVWALTGLGMRPAPQREHLDRVKEALKDPAPSVRVAAAESLCRWEEIEAGLPALREALGNENEWVRLAAVNALDRLGKKGRPALEDLRRALKDSNPYVVRVAEHAVRTLTK